MKKSIIIILIIILISLYSCTTLDRYDTKRDIFDPNNEKYINVTNQLSILTNNLTKSMNLYNEYAKEFESINNFDRAIDFTISLYFLGINTTGSIYTYNGDTSTANYIFGIGNIAGTTLLTIQTLLKATFYEQRKNQLENKMIALNDAIKKAREEFLLIQDFQPSNDAIPNLQQQVLNINVELEGMLISDIQPSFAE